MTEAIERRRLDRSASSSGSVVVAVSALIYWSGDRDFDAGRGDFFYLADAFLHGRTWLTFQPGPYDVIIPDGRFYVPFAPFPAVAFMPLVAILGRGDGRPDRVGDQRAPCRGRRRAVLVLLGADRRSPARRPAVADDPVRVLDADPVGHDARRRVAHRAARSRRS